MGGLPGTSPDLSGEQICRRSEAEALHKSHASVRQEATMAVLAWKLAVPVPGGSPCLRAATALPLLPPQQPGATRGCTLVVLKDKKQNKSSH